MTLTKADLEQTLCEQKGISHHDAKNLVEGFFGEISKALISGENVALSGFGNFDLKDKSERPGRNPRTGESIPILPRRVVTFKASDKCKAHIQGEG